MYSEYETYYDYKPKNNGYKYAKDGANYLLSQKPKPKYLKTEDLILCSSK